MIAVFIVALLVIWIVVHVSQGMLYLRLIDKKIKELGLACLGLSWKSWIMNMMLMFPSTLCSNNAYLKSQTKYRLVACYSDNAYESICGYNITITKCDTREKYRLYGNTLPSDRLIKFANYLETTEKCVGFCNTCPHYLYTTCREGSRVQSCEGPVSKLIKSMVVKSNLIENSTILSSVSGAALGLLCIYLVILFCLCCHKAFARQRKVHT